MFLATKLLLILQRKSMPNLPKTVDTFLKIDTNYDIITVENIFQRTEQDVYFGIVKGLEKCVNPGFHLNQVLKLIFHVNGVSIYRSNSNQFWLILCRVHCDEHNVLQTSSESLARGVTSFSPTTRRATRRHDNEWPYLRRRPRPELRVFPHRVAGANAGQRRAYKYEALPSSKRLPPEHSTGQRLLRHPEDRPHCSRRTQRDSERSGVREDAYRPKDMYFFQFRCI